jgi:hypothetical protein
MYGLRQSRLYSDHAVVGIERPRMHHPAPALFLRTFPYSLPMYLNFHCLFPSWWQWTGRRWRVTQGIRKIVKTDLLSFRYKERTTHPLSLFLSLPLCFPPSSLICIGKEVYINNGIKLIRLRLITTYSNAIFVCFRSNR